MNTDLKHLFNIELFSELTITEKKTISENSVVSTFSKGDLIIKKGVLNNQLFLLTDGFVKVFAENNNETRIIDVLKKARLINILSIFTNNIYNMSASAVSDCTIISFDKNILQEIISENKKFQKFIFHTISDITSRYIQFLAFQNKKNVRGRVAEVLLYLSNIVYEKTQFPQTFTRKEMADMSNTTTETIIRIYSEFKRDKIIELENKNIKIINSNLLIKLAFGG